MLFSLCASQNYGAIALISWKSSLKRLNEEYEIAKKKKEALDNLLSSERISKDTYDVFDAEIERAIAEIDGQRKALLEKMNSQMVELEGQIKTLEMLLANFEIQHVAGEIDEEAYQRQIGLLSTGLETTRLELDAVKENVNQLSSSLQMLTEDLAEKSEIESPLENVEGQEAVVEVVGEQMPAVQEVAEVQVEHVEVAESHSEDQQEQPQEAVQSAEDSQVTTQESTQEA